MQTLKMDDISKLISSDNKNVTFPKIPEEEEKKELLPIEMIR